MTGTLEEQDDLEDDIHATEHMGLFVSGDHAFSEMGRDIKTSWQRMMAND